VVVTDDQFSGLLQVYSMNARTHGLIVHTSCCFCPLFRAGYTDRSLYTQAAEWMLARLEDSGSHGFTPGVIAGILKVVSIVLSFVV